MVLWKGGGTMTSAEIQEKLKNRKGWKLTSVLTFLARLAEKGFVSVSREGRINRYTPLVSQRDYRKGESRSILKKLYGNSLTAFVAALYDGAPIEKKELEDLRRYLEDAERGRQS